MNIINRRKILEYWWLIPATGTLSTFAYMGIYASKVTFGKKKPSLPNFIAKADKYICSLPDISKVWDEFQFNYDTRPCILLQLPQATLGSIELEGRHYAAYSRVCTHLGCSTSLIRDTEVIAFAFNYRPPESHPQLGCRCHYSVFDPLRAGEAVFGKATLPLPRVQLEIRGKDIFAIGIEPAPKIEG